MARGVPSTFEAWLDRIERMPQYSHLSSEQKVELARQKLADSSFKPDLSNPEVPSNIEEFLKNNPDLKRQFTKLWKETFRDTEGPKSIRETLSKLFALTALSYERLIVEFTTGKSMVTAAAINNLRMAMVGLAQALGVEPGNRKVGKSKDERLVDQLNALAEGEELKAKAEELAKQDEELFNLDRPRNREEDTEPQV